MGSVGVQIVCLALGVLGLVGVIVCCTVPRWKVSSFVGSNIVTAQVNFSLFLGTTVIACPCARALRCLTKVSSIIGRGL